jgi:hypothetical protein
MTDLELLLSLRDQINAHLAPAPPVDPPPPPVDSPTGRKPLLLWTEDLQRAYNRMKAEADSGATTLGAQWYSLIIANAVANDRYGDFYGLWSVIAYQMTGDATHAQRAYAKVAASGFAQSPPTIDDNGMREYAIELVVALDWLWPALTEAQRTSFLGWLDAMFASALDNVPFVSADMPIRTYDSDQSTGVYMGIALYGAGFSGVHQPAADLLARPCVGGLTSTGQNRLTLRNCITDYVAMAAGGEWIESSEYNLGTVRLLMIGVTGVQTATGVDHFPEVTAWAEQAATRYAHMLTPDQLQSFQWGDEQEPHRIRPFAWVTTAMLFDHPAARKIVYDFVASRGAVGINSAEPVARGFLLFDPYGPATHDPLPTTFHAPGQGIISARTAWTPDASQFCAHFPPFGPGVGTVDHIGSQRFFGNVQLYRNGKWALTHPIAYGTGPLDGRMHNGMLHCGFGSPVEFRGARTLYEGSDWLYAAGTAGGAILASTFYQPPPKWWHEWSRSVLWLKGDVDTLIVFDRTHVDDPVTLPRFAAYSATDESKMQNNPLRAWRWHMPVSPTVSGNTAQWAIGDEQARITWLRSDLTPTIVNQATAFSAISMVATERKFHLDLVPPRAGGFQTCATVLEFGNPAAFATVSLLQFGATGNVLGVRLTRAGQPDRTVFFNAAPSPKLFTPANNVSAYDPQIATTLGPVRLRDEPWSAVGRVWQMETASGVAAS